MTWNYADGEKMIDRAIALDSSQADFHLERGLIEIELKNPEEAEKSLLEALRLHPEIPGGHAALGRLYLELLRDPERALPYLETALRFNPTDSRACLYQGNAYLRKGDLPKAVSSLQRAVELDPAYERAHFLLGTALQRMGRKEAAAHHFAESARVGPQARMDRARRVRMLDPGPADESAEPGDSPPTR
jgi:tetratricopeptide (TPR) repeat protein